MSRRPRENHRRRSRPGGFGGDPGGEALAELASSLTFMPPDHAVEEPSFFGGRGGPSSGESQATSAQELVDVKNGCTPRSGPGAGERFFRRALTKAGLLSASDDRSRAQSSHKRQAEALGMSRSSVYYQARRLSEICG